MKTFPKIICLVPLLLVVAIAPLAAQTDNADTNSTPVTSPSAPAAPKAPVPDNNAQPRVPRVPTAPQVHINPHGIYVDGSSGGFGFSGPSATEATVAIVAILSPFACIVVVCGLIFESRRRRNELIHETLRTMIEKGVPIPPELISPPDRTRRRREKSDLRSGLVMLALGVGLMILLAPMHVPVWPIGFIFVLMGGAFLLAWKLEKKDAANTEAAPK
ncbi:MAG TPA: DUF6249 domain-containing protein [Verrucomicrobiae bacterium]|jgi:hypothetical protein|nr:DUF6249 domain-containing protein [Verrucomicrobiae bacterium]